MNQWINYLNKSYMDLYGQNIQIFKLDKTATKLHELYIEEAQSGRIYLPPLEMHGLYNDGKWKGYLGGDMYLETEPPMTFYFNFENMVQKIDSAKKMHVSDIYVTYTGSSVPYIKKMYNKLSIWEGKVKLVEYDLLDPIYSTVNKIVSAIQIVPNFSCKLVGKNDLSKNIIDFDKIGFSGRDIMFYTQDTTYKNITDIIEIGDAILTSKYRLYEVQNAAPDGEFGWAYVTWKLECKLANVENFNLPGNYIDLIEKNAYGLKTKIDME